MWKILVVLTLLINIYSAVAQTTVKLENRNGVYYIPCSINGLAMSFIFDTGASDVTISLTEAQFMLKNGYLDARDVFNKHNYRIANGDIVEGTSINIREIKIGSKYLYGVKATIMDNQNAPLLLGQSALKLFGKFQIDYSTETLSILENSNPNDVDYQLSTNNFTPNDYYKETYFDNGDKYIGYYNSNGEQNGEGTYIWASGNKYVGSWKNGERTGNGIYTSGGGKKTGQFKNGLLDGSGTDSTSTSSYIGEFQDGEYNGQGAITWFFGDKYIGEFKNGKYNGQGTLTNKEGDQYVGEFKDCILKGHGTKTWRDGEIYVGEFEYNHYHGQGTLTWPDGMKYIGEFKNGKVSGLGCIYYTDGRLLYGEFENGEYASTLMNIYYKLKCNWPNTYWLFIIYGILICLSFVLGVVGLIAGGEWWPLFFFIIGICLFVWGQLYFIVLQF